jgi:hypothetical protein
MPISMPATTVLTDKNADCTIQIVMMTIFLHGELGWPLSYLNVGSVVIAVDVSVTDMDGTPILGLVFGASVRKGIERYLVNRLEYLKYFSAITWHSMYSQALVMRITSPG